MINFWKDPSAEPCCICGEEDAEEKHGELACPYDYLVSPAGYVPCRARFAAWKEDTEAPSGHRVYLRRFVRVTNMPERCPDRARLAALFAGSGR